LPKKLVPATSINGAQRIDGTAQKEFHAHLHLQLITDARARVDSEISPTFIEVLLTATV
jgi:hypothetical protein